MDEAGQRKFKLGTWEAIQRRLSIHSGRILITTTPYGHGWLRDTIYLPWKRAKTQGEQHSTYDVINFKSTENPSFPVEEYERTKAILPPWKHRMFYDGEFERPAGVIYDCFDRERHVIAPFPIPEAWPKHLGLDFGGVHTAGIYFAEEMIETPAGDQVKTGRLIAYREYPERARWAQKAARDHVRDLLKPLLLPDDSGHADFQAGRLPPGLARRIRAVGGSKSEDQWREEFRVNGLQVHEPPISEVEPGNDKVYQTIVQDQLRIFDTCGGLIDQLESYGRVLNEMGEPTEAIEDKEDFHYLDCIRYGLSYLKGVRQQLWMK